MTVSKKGIFFFRNRFLLKIFTGFTVVFLLLVVSINLFFQKPLKDFYLDELTTNLTRINTGIEPAVSKFITEEDHSGLETFIRETGKKINLRMTVIKPDGRVAADSESDIATMDDHSDRPEVISALKNGSNHSIRFSSSVGEQMLYVASPVLESGEVVALIRTSIYLREIREFMGSVRRKLLNISAVFFLLSLLISWYLSKKLNRPVRSIIEATEKFAAGDFNTKLYFRTGDEFGKLAASFNSMVEKQEKIISELSEREEELSTVISSMEEGLIVINREGRIIHSNGSFRSMCGIDDTGETVYWQVIRIPDIKETIDRSFSQTGPVFREFKFNGRDYLATFSKIHSAEKMVITFKDITGIKELETMKKDFILNLTHELKTPLTAIIGFAETLEDEEDIKNKTYIDIIKRHAERMNMIVSDLMVISELEDEKSKFEFRPVDLSSILGNILKIFNDKLSEKGIPLTAEIQPDLPMMMGEEFKLEQMFINLIDNAKKYTEKGEIHIRLFHFPEERLIRFSINNTGSYIPEDAVPRIFERFFVVDKSRSRNLGGTGLGLSIVKHVVQLHSGKISVKSDPENGTTFTVDFPAVEE